MNTGEGPSNDDLTGIPEKPTLRRDVVGKKDDLPATDSHRISATLFNDGSQSTLREIPIWARSRPCHSRVTACVQCLTRDCRHISRGRGIEYLFGPARQQLEGRQGVTECRQDIVDGVFASQDRQPMLITERQLALKAV